MGEYLLKTLDPAFKGAVPTYLAAILYTNSLNKHNFSFNILNEPLLTNQIVFYFTKDFYLVDVINEKMSQFKSNGMLNFLMFKYVDAGFKNPKNPPSSLNLKHVEGAFTLFGYGLLAASASFIFELKTKLIQSKIFNSNN